ncbi:hypothetical protein [Burkholderia cepacia]|uniref:Flagellar assembly protein FliH/Type III secretion system HrpE domain-containing protein n=1 Tax=Burkholderia cepacia TaxID=292 RepID=A0AA88Z201_BURCE|nr:hypothetical protein [Burkholderia cepacia]KGB99179.1 hypothetical protein DM43_3077 [Burkholderia cepacia]
MSTLLKAGSVHLGAARKSLGAAPLVPAVAPIGLPVAEPPPNATPSSDGIVDALETRLRELEKQNAQLKQQAEERERLAHRKGWDEGIAKGKAQAEHDHAAQLDALQNGIREALQSFDHRLDSIEALALDIARAALDKIFGDPSLHAALIAQTVRHHLSHIATGTVLGIEVSQANFPDSEQLRHAFDELITHDRVALDASAQLPAGACLIALTLGKLDASPARQYERIAGALASLRGQT